MDKSKNTPILDKYKEITSRAKNQRENPTDGNHITVDWVNANRPLSYSSLKHFRKSPQHYLEYIAGEFKQTPAMIEGSILDILLLEPHRADDQFAVSPKFDRRTNKGKEAFSEFMEANKGKLIVDEETLERIFKAVEAVHKDEDAMYYLNRVKKVQVPLMWKDPETGLMNRGFVDGESEPETQDEFILDLKKTADAATNPFIRQAYNLDYHLQVGGYTLGYKRQKFRFPDFIHLAVETTPPFGVNIFRADSKYIEQAQEEYQHTLRAFKYCIDHGLFHQSYAFHRFSVRYNRMELPGYARPVFG